MCAGPSVNCLVDIRLLSWVIWLTPSHPWAERLAVSMAVFARFHCHVPAIIILLLHGRHAQVCRVFRIVLRSRKSGC